MEEIALAPWRAPRLSCKDVGSRTLRRDALVLPEELCAGPVNRRFSLTAGNPLRASALATHKNFGVLQPLGQLVASHRLSAGAGAGGVAEPFDAAHPPSFGPCPQ